MFNIIQLDNCTISWLQVHYSTCLWSSHCDYKSPNIKKNIDYKKFYQAGRFILTRGFCVSWEGKLSLRRKTKAFFSQNFSFSSFYRFLILLLCNPCCFSAALWPGVQRRDPAECDQERDPKRTLHRFDGCSCSHPGLPVLHRRLHLLQRWLHLRGGPYCQRNPE